jgi:hypothetical protein
VITACENYPPYNYRGGAFLEREKREFNWVRENSPFFGVLPFAYGYGGVLGFLFRKDSEIYF